MKRRLKGLRQFVSDQKEGRERSGRFTWGEDDLEFDPKPPDKKDEKKEGDRVDEKAFANAAEYERAPSSRIDRYRDTMRHRHVADALEHRKTFGTEHYDAMTQYKSSNCTVNNRLRRIGSGKSSPDDMTSEHRSLTKALDHVTGQKIKHHAVVYRGMETSPYSSLASLQMMRAKPGDTFKDHGYASTSFREGVTHGFTLRHPEHDLEHPESQGWRHVMKIHAPPGTKGHFLDAHRHMSYARDRDYPHEPVHNPKPEYEHPHEHEREFLLHRGTTFRVLGHSRNPTTKTHYTHVIVHHQD